MTPAHSSSEALEAFRSAIGRGHVLTGKHRTKAYRTGYRSQEGECFAVLRPGTLVELWRVLEIAVRGDFNIIMQAANTGLTGGSSPQDDYDKDVVIISTQRLRGLHVIGHGRQVICLPGSTLHELEQRLRPLGREPHSVIGSSCLGASVIGGVCNNSGGALVERGPAYTEYAVFARIDTSGQLVLENHLGADLGRSPEDILTRLEAGAFSDDDFRSDQGMASDHEYKQWVRDLEAPTPARYNGDARRLRGAAGCAGKLAVFAVRLDTFPRHDREKTFFIGARDEQVLTDLRRDILSTFADLPVSAEYMDRETFAFTERYGRDTVYLIRALGTHRLPAFFKLKETVSSWLDGAPLLGASLLDDVLQFIGRRLPNPLPGEVRAIAKSCPHLLILKMKDDGVDMAAKYLTAKEKAGALQVHPCTERDAQIVSLHRFAAAGAAVRYHALKGAAVGDLLALDIALARNTAEWRERLPDELEDQIEQKLCYGHFMCHVFHQDYVLKAGRDAVSIKAAMLERLDARGAKYPAEHNVGHVYEAEPHLSDHYRSLDPRNQLNPGIGKDSKRRFYAD